MKKLFLNSLISLIVLSGLINAQTVVALSPPIKAVYLNQSFTLQKGETATLVDYSISIGFKGVVFICVDPPMEGPLQPGVKYGCYPDVAQLLLGSPLTL